MNKAVFVIFSQFVLLLLQLVMGNGGWTLPFSLLGTLCVTLSMGRNWGIFSGLLGGMSLSALYGGSWNLLYTAVNPLLAMLLNWWIVRHDEDIRFDFWQPGAWAGFAGALPMLAAMLVQYISSGILPDNWYWLIVQILWSAAVSAPLFVLFMLINEGIAEYLGLPRFLTGKGGQSL